MLADGRDYETLVPRYHCWTRDGEPLKEHEPIAEANGLLACLVIELLGSVDE